MESNTEKIVLQGFESVLHILRDTMKNQLILIGLIQSGQSRPEALAAVARNVRSGLYTLDALGDNVREALASNPNH